MILKLTPFHFSELIKKGYDLNCIFLMKLIHEQMDISTLRLESAKIEAIYTGLIRKGLITEAGDALTTVGQELLIFLDTKELKKLMKKKVDSTEFNLWWEAFPSTNTFTYKGVHFEGDRSLRQKENDCRLKIDKILLDGKYTIQDLIDALNREVTQKKESSIRERENKLKYMHNSLTYLNQEDYKSFIKLNREEKEQNIIVTTQTKFDGVNL